MKYRVLIFLILIFSGCFLAFSWKKKLPPVEKVKKKYALDCREFYDRIDSFYNHLKVADLSDTFQRVKLCRELDACKASYKKSEMLTEYFFPATAEGINGPLVNEPDEDEGTQNPIIPEGLQVIQDIMYNGDPVSGRDELLMEARRTVNYANRLVQVSSDMHISDWQVFDALKQQVVRIFILSPAGYDSPVTHTTLDEMKTGLKSIQVYIEFYTNINTRSDKNIRSVSDLVNRSVKYLDKFNSYEGPDRYYMITEFMNPLFESIEFSKREAGIEVPEMYQPLRLDAVSYWQTGSYDMNAYSRYDKGTSLNKDMAELGKLLFFDPVLSGNTRRSCASCHQPDKAFTDGYTTSNAFVSGKQVLRNAPSLLNVGFQGAYFYDSRASTLEDQARFVVEDTNEVHGDLTRAASILGSSLEYRNLFIKAFKGTTDTVISPRSVVRALAAYQRSLFSMNSKFDNAIRKEKTKLNASEINGFNLFMGKALCGTCHFAPLFNGNLPPQFLKTETEVIGVPSSSKKAVAVLDPDRGRGKVTGLNVSEFGFKTPGLRNISLTAPYMHNGVFSTLEEVVDFYNDGGGAGWNFGLENQTLPFDSLRLTETEKKDLVSFLHTLTDTTVREYKPLKLPGFPEGSVYNSRMVGGTY